jgi:hypothetical protein
MWNLVCWQDTCIELEGSGIVSVWSGQWDEWGRCDVTMRMEILVCNASRDT